MSETRWIVIPHFNDLQHPDAMRSESGMPWIKCFTRTLSDDAVIELSTHRRWIFLGLLMHYGRSRGLVTVSTARLSRYLSCRVTMADLESLNHAGLIEFSASKPASTAASKVASPTREEKRRNPPTPLAAQNGKPRTPSPKETPTLVDAVTACQHFIEGRAWDETFDEQMMVEEFGRIERGRRTEGTIGNALPGLLEQWAATRQDRYGIKANLTA